MGLVGLTKTLAIEGARNSIKANAIAPVAWTRMTEELLPAEFEAKFAPERVSAARRLPRARARARSPARCSRVGGGRVARVFVAEGPGWQTDDLTPEAVADNWASVMAEQPYVLTAADSMKAML